FTVLSMSLSLVAVFIPILLMGGIVGRLFREFAVTLSAAILISLVVSLTTTPMMCGGLLHPEHSAAHGRLYAASGRLFEWTARGVESVMGFTGGGGGATRNTGRVFIQLKPLGERGVSADQVIARLRGRLARVPGAPAYLQAVQDLRIGGMASNAQYQYTLQG